MTIFTYYERMPLWDHSALLNIWKSNWQKHGFRTIVCGKEMARKHPLYGPFVQKTRTFPTINGRQYEEACYIRWLAFEVMMDATDGRALMSDYDVYANGFNAEQHLGQEDIRLHELTRVPCLVEANRKGAAEIIAFIMSREMEPECGHYSDMYAFKESNWPITGFCQEHGEVRGAIPWEQAPAIHYASGAIQRALPGADKINFIRGYIK